MQHVPHRRVETTPEYLVERYANAGFRGIGHGGWWRTYRSEHLVPSWRCASFSDADEAWWRALPETIRHRFTVYGGPWT